MTVVSVLVDIVPAECALDELKSTPLGRRSGSKTQRSASGAGNLATAAKILLNCVAWGVIIGGLSADSSLVFLSRVLLCDLDSGLRHGSKLGVVYPVIGALRKALGHAQSALAR
jgi:hypothetical protein